MGEDGEWGKGRRIEEIGGGRREELKKGRIGEERR